MELPDKTVRSSYCHGGGFIHGGVGETLANYYDSPAKVKQVTGSPDIATLGPSMSQTTLLREPRPAQSHANRLQYIADCRPGGSIEYAFLWDGRQWLYALLHGNPSVPDWEPVEAALHNAVPVNEWAPPLALIEAVAAIGLPAEEAAALLEVDFRLHGAGLMAMDAAPSLARFEADRLVALAEMFISSWSDLAPPSPPSSAPATPMSFPGDSAGCECEECPTCAGTVELDPSDDIAVGTGFGMPMSTMGPLGEADIGHVRKPALARGYKYEPMKDEEIVARHKEYMDDLAAVAPQAGFVLKVGKLDGARNYDIPSTVGDAIRPLLPAALKGDEEKLDGIHSSVEFELTGVKDPRHKVRGQHCRGSWSWGGTGDWWEHYFDDGTLPKGKRNTIAYGGSLGSDDRGDRQYKEIPLRTYLAEELPKFIALSKELGKGLNEDDNPELDERVLQYVEIVLERMGHVKGHNGVRRGSMSVQEWHAVPAVLCEHRGHTVAFYHHVQSFQTDGGANWFDYSYLGAALPKSGHRLGEVALQNVPPTFGAMIVTPDAATRPAERASTVMEAVSSLLGRLETSGLREELMGYKMPWDPKDPTPLPEGEKWAVRLAGDVRSLGWWLQESDKFQAVFGPGPDEDTAFKVRTGQKLLVTRSPGAGGDAGTTFSAKTWLGRAGAAFVLGKGEVKGSCVVVSSADALPYADCKRFILSETAGKEMGKVESYSWKVRRACAAALVPGKVKEIENSAQNSEAARIVTEFRVFLTVKPNGGKLGLKIEAVHRGVTVTLKPNPAADARAVGQKLAEALQAGKPKKAPPIGKPKVSEWADAGSPAGTPQDDGPSSVIPKAIDGGLAMIKARNDPEPKWADVAYYELMGAMQAWCEANGLRVYAVWEIEEWCEANPEYQRKLDAAVNEVAAHYKINGYELDEVFSRYA